MMPQKEIPRKKNPKARGRSGWLYGSKGKAGGTTSKRKRTLSLPLVEITKSEQYSEDMRTIATEGRLKRAIQKKEAKYRERGVRASTRGTGEVRTVGMERKLEKT